MDYLDFKDLVILGMGLLLVAVLSLLYKYLWAERSPAVITASSTDTRADQKKVKDVDLFNISKASVAKTTRVMADQRVFYLVQYGDDKVLIMEEQPYIPEQRDGELTASVLASAPIHEEEGYRPEPGDTEMADRILGQDNDIDDIREIYNESNRAYLKEQKDLFDMASEEGFTEEETDQ